MREVSLYPEIQPSWLVPAMYQMLKVVEQDHYHFFRRLAPSAQKLLLDQIYQRLREESESANNGV